MQLSNKSHWRGFEKHSYIYNGREVIAVFPNNEANNKWVWRTEFFDAFPYADIEMVKRGYTLVYYKTSDLFGAPCAVDLMRQFHKDIVKKLDFENNPILFGFSRGGLYAFNYSCRYPDEISALYLDAPVLDIKSWPGGLMAGEGDETEWERCLKVYGYNDILQAMEYEFSDRIKILSEADIPIIVVAGDSDIVVPYEENAKILKEHYEKQGGNIKVILKKGVGHHPHSLEDPLPIVEYLIENSI